MVLLPVPCLVKRRTEGMLWPQKQVLWFIKYRSSTLEEYSIFFPGNVGMWGTDHTHQALKLKNE